MTTSTLSHYVRYGWGMGSLGTGALLNTITFLALFFMTNQVGINPALAGTLIFGTKIYDMFTDPIMGWLSDRTDTKWGRRRPYLFLGAFVCSLSMLAFFNPPMSWSANAIAAYMTIALLLYATGYTIFNVPYMAMPAEMTPSYDERSRLMSSRVIFVSIGTLIGSSAAPYLISYFGEGLQGYAKMSVLVSIIILLSMLVSFQTTRNVAFTNYKEHSFDISKQIRLFLDNKPFVILILCKLINLLGVAAYLSSALFFFKIVLEIGLKDVSILFLVQTIGTIASMRFWVYICQEWGKKHAYFLAAALHVAFTLSWLLASPDEAYWIFILRGVLLGISTGGLILAAQAMLPDAIAWDAKLTGINREASLSAIYSLVEKGSFAFGPLLVGLALNYSGFEATLGDQQPRSALTAVTIAFCIFPAIAALLSAVVLRGYSLSKKQIALISKLATSE